MSLVQIAFLSFRLAGYFTANAGGEGAISAKLYTLLRRVGLRHSVIFVGMYHSELSRLFLHELISPTLGTRIQL